VNFKSKQLKKKAMGTKILFVDDSKPMLALLSGVFKSDYYVDCNLSALDALVDLEVDNLPDLIVTDVNMPVMDGFEFVMRLKSNPYFEHIPIIVLSGNQDSSDRIKLLKMGADEFLAKPFNPEELKVKAEKILDRRRIVRFNSIAA